MADKYLTWIETRIVEVSNYIVTYDKYDLPKLMRDMQKILETLEGCKTKYLECQQQLEEDDQS